MSYLQAIVIALVQGVTELFPISSLGHSVLLPAWIGGSWQTLVTQSSQSSSESSFYLAYIVALHVATALALLWFFRADWVRIIRGLFRSSVRMVKLRRWDIGDADERLAWMLVIATIPVGLTGIALEHSFRTLFAKPQAAAIFLFINGLILLGGEVLRRRVKARGASIGETDKSLDPLSARAARESDANVARLGYKDALIVGTCQIAALFAGISRSGVTIVGGLWRGLDHEDSGPIRVPAGHPYHSRRRRAQAAVAGGVRGCPHPRPGHRRVPRLRSDRLRDGAVLGPVLRDSDAHTFRHLLPGRWRSERSAFRFMT